VLEHLEKSRLTRQKFPTEWHVLPELPVTASGKVQKHLLLEHRTPRETESTRGT
jgi:acyl-CoA synthetase (AMP-forming)/AMP-acid ligase II